MHLTRNQAYLYGYRGFESLPLRQVYLESIIYETNPPNTSELPGNFARSSISMELEIVLR